jgi:hypothetical protein
MSNVARDGFCDRLVSENLIVRETRKVILVTIRRAALLLAHQVSPRERLT